MSARLTVSLVALVPCLMMSLGSLWGATAASNPDLSVTSVSYSHKALTLSVQEYGFNLSPQGILSVGKMYYYPYDHALIILASANSNVAVSQVLSDARTYNMTGFKITKTPTWFIIPGWNCGYSNDNGLTETTLMVTLSGTFRLNYRCIYPPATMDVIFSQIVAPIHTPCTYVGSQPPSCTSLVD